MRKHLQSAVSTSACSESWTPLVNYWSIDDVFNGCSVAISVVPHVPSVLQVLSQFLALIWRQMTSVTLRKENEAKTRKYVNAECRHDMRPSIHLPSSSSADSKLDLTMVRPSLPSAPDTRLLRWFLTSGDLDLWPFQLKIGTPRTRAPGNVYKFLIFYVLPSDALSNVVCLSICLSVRLWRWGTLVPWPHKLGSSKVIRVFAPRSPKFHNLIKGNTPKIRVK